MILPYINLNLNLVPSENEVKNLVNLLDKAVTEIVTDLELLNFLARPWDLAMKNKYNHLLYTANKIDWHVPNHLIIECAKMKTCLERLEAVYKEAERDKLV